MENKIAISAKSLFSQDNVKQKFQEMLGKKAQGFITSVLQIVQSNDLLKEADPMSIYNSAAVAATLDLPLNNSLGFAYIVPYKAKQKDGSYKQVAQFQLGYRGFIQLVQRTGQVKSIYSAPIYEGQLISENPLDGYEFDFTKKSDKIIGYACKLRLLTGFEATLYMSKEKVDAHGKRFSQTYKKGFGLWNDDFDSMALKTVTKLLLSKYAPMSIELNKAVIVDQAVINNDEGTDVSYSDHEEVSIDKEAERVRLLLEDCKTPEEVDKMSKSIPAGFEDSIMVRKDELKSKK